MTETHAVNLDQLTHALRRSWGPETCAPEDRAQWTPGNPARGQCITTVLVVHDFLGGDLRRGEVHVDGERVDFHWWNVLPDGTVVDLTGDQFDAHEQVVAAETFERPRGSHRVEEQYDRLREQVQKHLSTQVARDTQQTG